MDVSIIIVTYNGLDITLQTLAAYQRAIQADASHQYEIIVVDNASPNRITKSIAQAYPSVQIIENAENFGFSKANNVGYAASQGRYVLFSNPDIEVNTDTLPTLIDLMDKNLGVGVCTPFLKLAKTGEIDWGAHRGFPTPWAALTYYGKLAKFFKNSRLLSKIFGQYHLLASDLSQAHEVDVIRGGFFFVRRTVFETAGQWDERYFMFGEDIDLCYQIKQKGHKIMFYPQAQALHYHGMTTGLKAHSQNLTPIDQAAQERTYMAFYDAMQLFYDKNYAHQYNKLVRWFVFLGITLKRNSGKKRKVV